VGSNGADRLILALARRQQGAAAARQFAAAGVSRDVVRHRVSTGWLVRRYRGVYLVGPLRTPLTEPIAAVLALGEAALLSHYPAAVLWGLRPPARGAMEVTVVGRNARGPGGINVHRVIDLHPADRAIRHQIPTTSPARTLLDLATQVTQRDLDRATDEARVHRLVTDPSLNEQFQRYPHHRGTAALRRAIQTEPALTRSEAERRLLELIRAAGLPEPETNARVGRWEVDFLWREARLIVEVDGYAFHSSRSSFERDRRRDADLTAHGIRVMRVTWRRIERQPEAVVATLAAALARLAAALGDLQRAPEQRYQR
jgi:very-short-patch-repair endonuclease